ncbi:MAG: MT-A70 family methyltransferase [Aggregatilineales bacterium]
MTAATRYPVILADPPWQFRVYSKATEQGRSAESHYPTMSLADICALPVSDLASPDCTLFMWTTLPTLPEALQVINSWGFTYKTAAFVWAKLNKRAAGRFSEPTDSANWFCGMGFYTRANAELCLLATRGSPKRQHADVRQLIVAPIREHSRKPDEQYSRIERLLPGPYVELFARHKRAGWSSWGNEIEPDFTLTNDTLREGKASR